MGKNYYVGLAIFSAFLIFLMIAVPQSLGLGKGGFDSQEVLTVFFFYTAPGIAFLIGILLLEFVEHSITSGDSKYGSGLGFWGTGETPSIRVKRLQNPLALLLLSLIFFSIIGLVSFVFLGQQSFTGIGKIEQQFTPTDDLVFSLSAVVPSENLGAGFLLAFALFSLRVVARKYKLSSQNFRLIALFGIPLLIGTYGVINHTLRYHNSDTALTVVFFFWALGGLLTVLIGNAIPFLVMHGANNFFGGVKEVFSSDTVTLLILMVVASLAFVYYWFFIRVKR